MDPDVRFLRKVHLLTDAEIVRLVKICVGLGVSRVRLTGGEPTLHPTLTELVGDLGALRSEGGLRDLAMTTNGAIATEQDYRVWRERGLSRLTLSLDTLRADRFAAITRSSCDPDRVVRSIGDAHRAGLAPIKVNMVVMRGVNEDEIEDFAELAREHDVDVRFIEFMPLDSGRRWNLESVVTADEIVARIDRRFGLEARGRPRAEAPATEFAFADGAPGRIGVIASVSRPFCGACSRLRITADGKVMPCLFSREEWDVRGLLRGGATDEEIARFLAGVTWSKQAGHGMHAEAFEPPDRPMSAIGG